MDKAVKLDELIDGAESLLIQLTDAHNPEIQKLRDRVDYAIHDARGAMRRSTESASVQIRDILQTVDDYIHDYPWLALITGVAVAATAGFITGSVMNSKKSSSVP